MKYNKARLNDSTAYGYAATSSAARQGGGGLGEERLRALAVVAVGGKVISVPPCLFCMEGH
jgi:hypothetical protein